MARKDVASLFAAALFIGAFASVTTSVHSVGVCYGVVGNNLPPANEVVQLYKSKGITGMRIYFADAKALSALRNSGISLILDVGGDEVLANLASSTSNAASWVQNNVRPYYPAVNIKYIAAGNEVQGGATQNIVPAMRNLNAALSAAGLDAIKVSTSIRFDAVVNSFPPSAGMFAQSYMTDVARLLASTGAPLLTNVYPYFAYRGNPGSISLNYATFQPGTSVRDQINGLTNTCLFDAMVDAVYAALEKAGAPGVKVVVSESGWPSAGGFAASADNARTYNQGLINHVGKGTPKKPSALETYIFAMFNENQKNGPNRPWQGIPMAVDWEAKQVCLSLMKITVGTGDRVYFWTDRWIHGLTASDIAPDVMPLVSSRARKTRTVQQALLDNAWALDVDGDINFTMHIQIANLCAAIATVPRDADSPDQFIWPAEMSGGYSARSAYERLCLGMVKAPTAHAIWRSWAPLRCKIFAWLMAQYRLWTSDRRARHGLQDLPSACYTCLQDVDDIDHILAHCTYATEVWHHSFSSLHLSTLPPSTAIPFVEWWLDTRRAFSGRARRGYDSFIIGTAWALWKQRNARVFNRVEQQRSPTQLVDQVANEIREWKLAGFGVGGLDPFMRE